MNTYYLDTSVAVHALLGDGFAAAWFERTATDTASDMISSRLLQTELTRVLRRDGKPVVDREIILERLGIVGITEGVLAVAEAIEQHVKTLHAIHLATALTIGRPVVLVSHDSGVLRAAATLGIATLDPLTRE